MTILKKINVFFINHFIVLVNTVSFTIHLGTHLLYIHKYIHLREGLIAIVVGNGHSDTSSNLDKADYISHTLIPLGKV